MEAILTWIAQQALTYLASYIEGLITQHEAQVKLDEANGVIDAGNLANYNSAKDRASKVAAATAILNGPNATPP